MSLELILPFLSPITEVLGDPDVSDIMVNGSRGVFIERAGVMESLPGVVIEEARLQVAAKHIARLLGDDVSEDRPILDARLSDGSRVAVVLPPCSVDGTTLTIRKFQRRLGTCGALVQAGMITREQVNAIRAALLSHQNVLISGGTGTGKTTLLNACVGLLPQTDRIVVIEDTAELWLAHPNLVRFEARRKQPGVEAVTIRDLLKASLRHRPDRIVIGEVRGGEAFDLLQALDTGHGGSVSTIHASSAKQALMRLATSALMGGVDSSRAATEEMVHRALHVIVHTERRKGTRSVTDVQLVSQLLG